MKTALDSLKDVIANASDSKPTQDKKDAKQGTEDSKDSDKMTETNSVPAGVIVVSLLALLGVIAFWLIRRKKESEIQQLSTELIKVLGQLDAEKADKKVLAKAQNLLQETLVVAFWLFWGIRSALTSKRKDWSNSARYDFA